MTAKERVRATFARESTDRVPMNYEANPAVHARVADALGVTDGDYVAVCDALGTDTRSVNVDYRGPVIYPELAGRTLDPVYGFYTRWVPNVHGGYMDFCDYPLKDADDDQIAAFPVVSPDDFDYSELAGKLERFKDFGTFVGSAGFADVINSLGRLMGMEDALVNLHTENDATIDLMNRKCDMELAVLDRLFSLGRGRIDFLWMGEDLGTQTAPMISVEMYRRVLKPVHKRYVELAKSYGAAALFHSCGSSSWAYDDLIELGVTAVDTLQPEADNMSPAYLKQEFGDRLVFHGCISTAGALAFGGPDEVRAVVKDTLDVMMEPVGNATGGGYFLSPTHWIQDNSPTANVLAMYQAGHDFGRYS